MRARTCRSGMAVIAIAMIATSCRTTASRVSGSATTTTVTSPAPANPNGRLTEHLDLRNGDLMVDPAPSGQVPAVPGFTISPSRSTAWPTRLAALDALAMGVPFPRFETRPVLLTTGLIWPTYFTSSTGMSQSTMTRWAMLPIKARPSRPCPWVPITSRCACSRWVARTISSAGEPTTQALR